jgi:thiol-disulfide isomerase/thioredoxin
MKRVAATVVLGLFALAGSVAGETAAPVKGPYDPAANGWKQVQAAAATAAGSGKRVLVVVGGNWCPWCRALDRLMNQDAALGAEVAAHYELVHLNYSKENKNPEAMARLGSPDKLGFPSFVVLSPQLKVLHLQESGVFETGDKTKPGHDPARLIVFLKRWEK